MDHVHSLARVATETPARYLGQLCKHFMHKLPVVLDGDTGSIAFPLGTCRLAVDGEALVMTAAAADAAALAQVQEVVARHLLRFAFRAPPEMVWQASAWGVLQSTGAKISSDSVRFRHGRA